MSFVVIFGTLSFPVASGLKFIPSFLNVLGLIMILNTAEKDEAITSGIYLCLLLLRC